MGLPRAETTKAPIVAAALAELAAHRKERGFGNELAKRMGVRPETLKRWMEAAGKDVGELFARRQLVSEADLEELRVHQGEVGYAWQVANRLGISETTLRAKMTEAGIDPRRMFAQAKHGSKIRHRTVGKLWNPSAEDEREPAHHRCGITGKACKRARFCDFSMDNGCDGNKYHPVLACAHAVESGVPSCNNCGHLSRCAEEWRCWFVENQEKWKTIRDEMCMKGGRMTVWDMMAEGIGV